MFFPERIKSIKPTDRVLEVGPGGTPHPRSDVLLEKDFTEEELKRQRGNAPALKTDKKVVIYPGGKFPFKDKEFDYVICSHVLEHIPKNELPFFCKELQRVSVRGYLEFPGVFYDYIYNIPEHVNLMAVNEDGHILFMDKSGTNLNDFSPVNMFFLETLEKGYVDMVNDLKNYFFIGFEWYGEIKIKEVQSFTDLVSSFDVPKKVVLHGKSCYEKLKIRLKKL